MEILKGKKLEILFSWAQFYHNSVQTEESKGLSVERYPRHYYYENGKKRTLIPYSDQMMYNKIQEEIREIGNKDSGSYRNKSTNLDGSNGPHWTSNK